MVSNRYYLMRKNEIITMLQLSDKGEIVAYSRNMSDRGRHIAPIGYTAYPEKYIYEWWKDRSIPITRDHINELLINRGYTTTQYLAKNLGLSLTDYYWIKPVDSNLSWDEINLYDNDFHDNIMLTPFSDANDDIPRYSPNGSLQGNIEKTWTIINGKRCIIKGNHSVLSRESINEIIATHIHELQGYDNYVRYNLIEIKSKPYKYGCVSEAFTSLDCELISAWDICTSEKRSPSISLYEHFINVCKNHGMDTSILRRDLEYQIMVDYILTGYDRHLNNISILRDANTLQFIRMAPIYDSGDCLFANKPMPRNIQELQKMEIGSFDRSESKLLKHVTDPNLLNLSKLPPVSYIRSVYEMDDNITSSFIDNICTWYERKIDMCDKFQRERR